MTATFAMFKHLLALVILVISVLACTSHTESLDTSSTVRSWMVTSSFVDQDPSAVVFEAKPVAAEPRPAYVDPDTALGQFIGLCEEHPNIVHLDPKTGKELPPVRRKISRAEQDKMKRHIALIAREMGADPLLFLIWALRESSYRWFKRHRLNPDMEAASVAWGKYRYTMRRADALEATMAATSAKSGQKDYWDAKAELGRISIYKDNPTYEADWRWATGYGLFGMQPVYHLKRWDPNAAPEILCDPIVATIVAVWAARSSRYVCASTGHGDSYQVVNRSFSTGHCESTGRESYFVKRAERRGLDYEASAQLGSKWPQKTTDRAEILARMRELIARDDAREAG